jgi:hypothetical protein
VYSFVSALWKQEWNGYRPARHDGRNNTQYIQCTLIQLVYIYLNYHEKCVGQLYTQNQMCLIKQRCNANQRDEWAYISVAFKPHFILSSLFLCKDNFFLMDHLIVRYSDV